MGWMENTVNGQRILEHTGILSTYSADAVLIPDKKIGIAILYTVSSTATNAFGSPQIRDGLLSLVDGRQPESRWMNVRLWGWITGLLSFAGGFLAIRSLLLLPGWSQIAHQVPFWHHLPGIVMAFVPALLFLGIPFLTARFADRVFGFVNLYKSMLGIFVWLALTGLLGAINGTVRFIVLLRRWLS